MPLRKQKAQHYARNEGIRKCELKLDSNRKAATQQLIDANKLKKPRKRLRGMIVKAWSASRSRCRMREVLDDVAGMTGAGIVLHDDGPLTR